jgi:hypothetical protein
MKYAATHGHHNPLSYRTRGRVQQLLLALWLITPLIFAQSNVKVLHTAPRAVRLSGAVASQGLLVRRLDHLVSSKQAFTFLAMSGKSQTSAFVVRTNKTGTVLWKASLGNVDPLDLIVAPSDETVVLSEPASGSVNELSTYSSTGTLLNRTTADHVMKLCGVGDSVFGVTWGGSVLRMDNHAAIAAVAPPKSAFDLECVGVAPRTAVVVDTVDGVLTTIDTVSGFKRRAALADNTLGETKKQYKAQLATEPTIRGKTIVAVAPFGGGIIALLSAGSPTTGVPLITVDLTGHTISTIWITLPVSSNGKSGVPAGLSAVSGDMVDVLDSLGNVSEFSLGPKPN